MGSDTHKTVWLVLMMNDTKHSPLEGLRTSEQAHQNDETRFDVLSDDVAARKRDTLRNFLAQSYPECLSESQIDFETLRRALGDWVDAGSERFGLIWPGKAQCMKIIQQPSVAALKPDRKRSVNFDSAKNVFIEGDNLEVLKLLQKAYFGRIKMIYIDPPYNTGQEFIYPDKYAESLETYLAYTMSLGSEVRKFSSYTVTLGRYRPKWLNMKYARS